MSRQDQRVSDGSVAAQAGRDVNITGGVSPEQMSTILGALAQQIPAYVEVARQLVDDRLNHFKDWVLSEFEKNKDARPEAFKDPDFQYLLTRAQQSYARCGDHEIGETLVKIIAERSKQTIRNRIALTLNIAAETSAALTKSEFSILSLIFFIYQSKSRRIDSFDDFVKHFENFASPFISDIDDHDSITYYLESQKCLSISGFQNRKPGDLFLETYPGMFSEGFSLDELLEVLPWHDRIAYDFCSLTINCLHNATRYQFAAIDEEVLAKKMDVLGIMKEEQGKLLLLEKSKRWTSDKVDIKLKSLSPAYATISDWFTNTAIARSKLTSLGTAIGIANFGRVTGETPDISIWIK